MSFSEMSHWPIQYRPEARPPKKSVMFWDFDPCRFRNSEDGPYYDYIVTRGRVDPLDGNPPGPAWRELPQVDAFRIFEKLPSHVAASSLPPFAIDLGPCTP